MAVIARSISDFVPPMHSTHMVLFPMLEFNIANWAFTSHLSHTLGAQQGWGEGPEGRGEEGQGEDKRVGEEMECQHKSDEHKERRSCTRGKYTGGAARGETKGWTSGWRRRLKPDQWGGKREGAQSRRIWPRNVMPCEVWKLDHSSTL